jgi:hypothetical protein
MVELQGLDKRSWLKWDGKSASITGIDDMCKSYLKRLKPCTSFDTLNIRQAENQVFGDANTDYVHFNPQVAMAIYELKDQFPDEYAEYYGSYASVISDNALELRKYLINPFNYIGTGKKCDIAPYYRIRTGTSDAHTSFTMAMTLALKLIDCGRTNVDYAMVWDEDHGPADYKGELQQWIERIC